MDGSKTNNENLWSYANSNQNTRPSSLPPQTNPAINRSLMRNSGENLNYYDTLSQFDNLSLSNPSQQLAPLVPSYTANSTQQLATQHPFYTDDQINRGGSGLRNSPLNYGMSLSHMNYFNSNGGLRGSTFNPLPNSLPRGLFFDEYVARNNLNGMNYDQVLGCDDYLERYDGYNGFNRYFVGEDLTRTVPRVSGTNRSVSGSSFVRNRTGLGNGNFYHESSSSHGSQNGCNNRVYGGVYGANGGVYGARQVANFSSLEELKGKLVMVAMDQQGGRFLQSKIEQGNIEDVEIIYSELKDRIRDLMVDQYANYIIQKLLEVCNEEQIMKLLLSVTKDDHILLDICIDMHGTKVMQKLIESLSNSEQRSLLVSALKRITVSLMKNVNGHHVIESCFKCFPPEYNEQILNVVADNCLEIAFDQSGCCVLQQCVVHAEGELRERLMAEIIANALILSEHPYGNYMVQHVVGLHIPLITAEIVARLCGNFVFLSVNKHGSNVVEHILKECPDHVNTIIIEIINSQNLLMVVQDPYGNYVIQTALAKSKGTVHYKLMTLIQNNYAFLHSHLYGKRVLAKTRIKGSRSFHI